MVSVETANKQVETWKNRLIDFSKRNQLLYFRPRTNMSVEIVENPAEIFHKLVLENSASGFRAQVQITRADDYIVDSVNENLAENLTDDLCDVYDTVNVGVTEMNYGGFEEKYCLQTNKDDNSLTQALSRLRSRSRDSLNEQGLNILYLALYFLQWSDSKSGESYKSPLILVPVSLERQGLNGSYKLIALDDEIRINPTLSYKLFRDDGVDLSCIEDRLSNIENQEELINLVEEARSLVCKRIKDSRILDECSLSLFSFAKLSLYKDIEENEGKIIVHPVIQQVSGISTFTDEQNNTEEKDIDKLMDANTANQILDADSSQLDAIFAAKAGQSFVLQGPPGTGKSQTIANIIAEALAQNKKILFVSEKKAALDVVVNRLQKTQLHHFCLELHGSKQKKSEFIHSIRGSLEAIKSLAVDSRQSHYEENIAEVKQSIQFVIDELHKIRMPINMSLFEIYGQISKLNFSKLNSGELNLNFTIKNIEQFSPKELADLDYFFNQLAKHSEIIDDYSNFIWRNANVSRLSFEIENDIRSRFMEFTRVLSKLKSYADPLSTKYFGREITTLREFKWLAEACDLAINSPFPNKDWFYGTDLEALQSITLRAKFEHEDYVFKHKKLMSRYSESFFDLDLSSLSTKFSSEYSSVLRFFNINYWKDIAKIKKTALYNEIQGLQPLLRDLENAVLLTQQSQEIQSEKTELSLMLGDFYKNFNTDWQETLTAIRWVKKVTDQLQSKLPTALIDVVSDSRSTDDFEEFKLQAQELIKSYVIVKQHLKFYKSLFPVPNIDFEHITISDLNSHIEKLTANIIKLEDWIEFSELVTKAETLGVKSFLDALLSNKPSLEDSQTNSQSLKEKFLKKFYELWADKIEIENPRMRKFNGKSHELLIDRFKELDVKQIQKVREELPRKLSLSWIEYASNPVNHEAAQILSIEINKKKRHKPIRTLLKEIPELLQTMKPCWMMSPLSVSQLIDKVEFDLVIFDEASQIRTEEAVCSIYRGKQLILAGDTNQLPPTNFFNYAFNDSDKEDDFTNNNFENILDECAVFLPNRILNWHYRSRHESLICFSNLHIYDNKLITFPSQINYARNLGVHFEFVEDGCYERGSRFNRKEAKRIAQAIIDHFINNPDKSLGVIAFSESQQTAIERELAVLLRKNPDTQIMKFFDEDIFEPLFIKNLENVQGDERDVIFFSVGYARDKEGILSHNFGPLNREGGHRRLNVAITRARDQLKVFSGICASDIDLAKTSAQGAVLLKKYLAYAQACEENKVEFLNTEKSITSNTSPNESKKEQIKESISEALVAHGYTVKKSLGNSNYKLDLAVISPNNPDEFALAIEIDGEMYKSALTVRDRERLRKQVLELLGWRLHKVWSRDWVKNTDEEINKILKLLQS